MIGGEFDLSSGVIVGTTGMFTGLFAVARRLAHRRRDAACRWPSPSPIGVLNGVMVVMSRLPSFIVTLGTFFALRGFNLWLTQQVTGQTQVTGIENADGYSARPQAVRLRLRPHRHAPGSRSSILWFVVMAVIGAWVLTRTKVGNWIFAVGGNKDAARMVGVPATATKIGLFMTVAVCGWVHGHDRAVPDRPVERASRASARSSTSSSPPCSAAAC